MISENLDALDVALFGIDVECLLSFAGLPQSPGIDVAHGFFPHRLWKLGGDGVPIVDILLVEVFQHVDAHTEQGILALELAALVEFGGIG